MSEGAFVWYELITSDPAAARQFYGSVVGWTAEPYADGNYWLFRTSEASIAGLMTMPPAVRERGVQPHWCGYIEVADVPAMLARAQAEGATLRHGPETLPAVGQFALLTDPDGAPFYLFAPAEDGPPPPPMSPGSVGWRELQTIDPTRASRFYAGLFGWTLEREMDMGPMGTYAIFAYGGLDRGGMMAIAGRPVGWLLYFVVEGIDAAGERVAQAGGQVVDGPNEVPGGAWTLLCRDPQGVAFALVSAKR